MLHWGKMLMTIADDDDDDDDDDGVFHSRRLPNRRSILSFGRRHQAYAATACPAAEPDRVGMLCSGAACLSLLTFKGGSRALAF